MAARDNLGGQFGSSKPQQIPAHHRDAILNAINSMGERGMEMVPGGVHVTPSDGGKSHFIPHASTQLHVSAHSRARPGNWFLTSDAPSEGVDVFNDVWGNNYTGPSVVTKIGMGVLASSMREEHDDPAHFMDRARDSVLSDRESHVEVATTGDSPRFYYQPHQGNESINSYETLSRLPHLGGNPKDPAQSFSTNLGQKGGVTSEDIDALKGLHRAYSHVYDVGEHDFPRTSVGPNVFRRGPVMSRDRHVFPVFVSDDENSTAYMYNTSNGQITKDFFED